MPAPRGVGILPAFHPSAWNVKLPDASRKPGLPWIRLKNRQVANFVATIHLKLTILLVNGNYLPMHITLDRMSRIVVPKAIRDRFALKPGDDLEITLEADGIRLRPAVPASPLAEEGGLLVC